VILCKTSSQGLYSVVLSAHQPEARLSSVQAVPGEETNMILIHCWEEEEPEDMHLEYVVDILLATYTDLSEDVDVRDQSEQVSEALKVAVATHVAQHIFGSSSQTTLMEVAA